VRKSIGTCQCGGELVGHKLVMARPRMLKVCEKCGSFHEKEPVLDSASHMYHPTKTNASGASRPSPNTGMVVCLSQGRVPRARLASDG